MDPLTHESLPGSRRPGRARRALATLGAFSLLAGLATVGATAAVAAPEAPLMTSATTWRYSENNTDPAEGSADRLVWTRAGFNDTAWKSAAGSFGAKNGKATGIGPYTASTLLNQYIDGVAAPDVKTYHFRSSFQLSAQQLAGTAKLTGNVTFDDAVQIFVNGTKVAGLVEESDAKIEAAPEAERNLMYAGVNAGDPVTREFTVPATALKAGENTIAVALYQDRAASSDIYFDLTSLVAAAPEPTSTPAPSDSAAPAKLSDIVLSVGSNESGRGLAWYSDIDTAQVAQVATRAAQTGTAFPAAVASTFPAKGAQTTSKEYNRFADITGLTENTEYVYRVGSDANGWSKTYSFRTQSFSGDYNFLFFGDPQIGASGNTKNDEAGWVDTVNVAQAAHPNAEMLFSAGDQVETAANEAQYESFLAPEQLRSIPLVPVNGNHDVGSKAYEQHYNVPNLDPNAGKATSATSSGGNYWFMHKGVLFMVLNSNSSDYAAHEAFLRKTVAEQGDKATWKVVAFHHSIYSVASHWNSSQIINLRAALPKVISDLGVDLVLQGHDHSYTRTYLIKDGVVANPDEAAAAPQVTANPGEVLYVTANSASGSKYYNVTNPTAWWASVINQEKVRNYSSIDITRNAITVKTMRSQAFGDEKPVNSVVDSVTLKRVDTAAPVITAPTESEIRAGEDFDPMAGITAFDQEDGDVSSKITVSGSVDTKVPGVYTLVYTVTDAAGNEATFTRTITVLAAAEPTSTPNPTEPGTDPTTPGTDPTTPGTDPTQPGSTPSVSATPGATSSATPSASAGAAAGNGENLAHTGFDLTLPLAGGAALLLIMGAVIRFMRRENAA